MLRKTVVGVVGVWWVLWVEATGRGWSVESDKNLTPTSIKGSPKIVDGIAIWLQLIAFHGLFVGWFAWAELEYVRLGNGEPSSAGQSSWCHMRSWLDNKWMINGWWMDDKWMMNETGLHLTQNSIETNLLLVAFLPQQRSTWEWSSNDGRCLYMKPLSFSHVTSCFH